MGGKFAGGGQGRRGRGGEVGVCVLDGGGDGVEGAVAVEERRREEGVEKVDFVLRGVELGGEGGGEGGEGGEVRAEGGELGLEVGGGGWWGTAGLG